MLGRDVESEEAAEGVAAERHARARARRGRRGGRRRVQDRVARVGRISQPAPARVEHERAERRTEAGRGGRRTSGIGAQPGHEDERRPVAAGVQVVQPEAVCDDEPRPGHGRSPGPAPGAPVWHDERAGRSGHDGGRVLQPRFRPSRPSPRRSGRPPPPSGPSSRSRTRGRAAPTASRVRSAGQPACPSRAGRRRRRSAGAGSRPRRPGRAAPPRGPCRSRPRRRAGSSPVHRHGDAPAAGADDDRAGVHEHPDRRQLDDPEWLGRRDHAAEVVAVAGDRPTALELEGAGPLLGVDGADRFRRGGEGGSAGSTTTCVSTVTAARPATGSAAPARARSRSSLALRSEDVERVGRHVRA